MTEWGKEQWGPGRINMVKPGEKEPQVIPPLVSPERIVGLWESFFANIAGIQGGMKDEERRAFAVTMHMLAAPPMMFTAGEEKTTP